MSQRAKTRKEAGFLGPHLLRSLLVPVDLTPSSDRILGRLPLLPVADDARLTLLHVVPTSILGGDRRDAEHDARAALAAEERHLRKSLPQKVRVEVVVKSGAAAEEIARCAKKVKAELIVMGRGSGRALRDAFLGSTAERVVRQARVSVLVVRRPPRASYARPALAVDLGQPLHEIVRVMLHVLPPPRPTVPVIHAFDVPYRGPHYPSLSGSNMAACRAAATRKLGTLLEDAFARARLASADVPSWSAHVRYGCPGSVVEKLNEANDTDLLVLGTHGHSGAAHLFLGTVAGDLLRNARCDVLVVPFGPSTA